MFKNVLIIAIFVVSPLAFSQNPNAAKTAEPTTMNATQTQAILPFATQIKKTVLFIELKCKDGSTLMDVKGTGFLVSIPAPELGKDQSFEYLVTNRHVALCWNDHHQPMEVQSISVRVNLKDGTSKNLPLTERGNIHWTLPKDDSVDLAVTPINTPTDKVDAITIPVEMFATKDVMSSQSVVEGSRIVFTGFFYQFPGERKIQPIIREGILAMEPDEPLTTTTGKPGTVYLGDVHIFHGNSGSPVFVDIAGGRSIPPAFRFLGVVSGNFSEDQDFNLEIDTTLTGTQHGNSGIALIVPADAVRSLLDDPTLQSGREAVLRTVHTK